MKSMIHNTTDRSKTGISIHFKYKFNLINI